MSEDTRKELTELIETIRQLDQTGLIIMQSNAEVLLARDRLTQRGKVEEKAELAAV